MTVLRTKVESEKCKVMEDKVELNFENLGNE